MIKLLAIIIGIVIVTVPVCINGRALAVVIPSKPVGAEGSPAEMTTQTTPHIPDNQDANIEKIRHASVSIVMLSPVLQNETTYITCIGQGIGTLIEYRGEILLVTHNHWGGVLQDATIIEFLDADNRLLTRILGSLWKSLVVYQDNGAQILRPPEGLVSADHLTPAGLPASITVEPGEFVFVAHLENPERVKIAILSAKVVEITTQRGIPVYKLRTLDGQTIQTGDSGGGIWHDGVLVGNNWSVLMKPAGETQALSGNGDDGLVFTDLSYAAQLPPFTNLR